MTSNLQAGFLLLIAALLSSCSFSSTRTYRDCTTKNLTALSCQGTQRLFIPIEFNSNGDISYTEQVDRLKAILMERDSPRDVYFFIHGWDKTVAIAEQDYQNFICHFVEAKGSASNDKTTDTLTRNNSIIVGLFWPSTIKPNVPDPALLKPLEYPEMRARADKLAITGIPALLKAVEKAAIHENKDLRLHLIGHSFGGRIMAAGVLSYLTDIHNNPEPLIYYLNKLDVVLLLPAAPSDALDTHKLHNEVEKEVKALPNYSKESLEALDKEKADWLTALKQGQNAQHNDDTYGPGTIVESVSGANLIDIESKRQVKLDALRAVKSMRELSGHYPAVRVFTIYSDHDWANKYLFLLGSTVGADRVACALGACGAEGDLKIVALKDGSLSADDYKKTTQAKMLSIDASEIISSHSDICNDYVAKLIVLVTN